MSHNTTVIFFSKSIQHNSSKTLDIWGLFRANFYYWIETSWAEPSWAPKARDLLRQAQSKMSGIYSIAGSRVTHPESTLGEVGRSGSGYEGSPSRTLRPDWGRHRQDGAVCPHSWHFTPPCHVCRHWTLGSLESPSPVKSHMISSDWPGLTVREWEFRRHELHRVGIKMKMRAAMCRQEGWRVHWKSERLATHHIICGLSGDRGNESETYILDQ